MFQPLRSRKPRGRYAPSPSGSQHFGNARTALLAWLQTRLQGGMFVVRMEDLDRPRVVPGSAQRIVEELEWMGLDWDEGVAAGGPSPPYAQSERSHLYAAAIQFLKQQGKVFRCVCSRRDIALAASAPHGRTAVYPGTCRDASIPAGRRHAWRFKTPPGRVNFTDEVAGPVSQDVAREVGDFVLRRADRVHAYQLAVVIDDALMGITDVVRGRDLLESTPRQIVLQRALGAPQPRYWHVPLVLEAGGRRMSKRSGSQTIEAYRQSGGSPREFIGDLAASVGLVPEGTVAAPSELLERLDLNTLRRRLRSAQDRSSIN